MGTWFQALFHSPPRGAFHLSLTVLVRYRSHGSILALGGGPPGFTPDFSSRALLRNTATGGPSPSATGLSPSRAPRPRGLRVTSPPASAGPSTPGGLATRFRQSARSARRYSGPRDFFLFLSVLRCFSSRGSPPVRKPDDRPQQAAGLPHSATRGSLGVCPSPRLIAAYRGLPRLRVPRHPPTCPPSLDRFISQAELRAMMCRSLHRSSHRTGRSRCRVRSDEDPYPTIYLNLRFSNSGRDRQPVACRFTNYWPPNSLSTTRAHARSTAIPKGHIR